jgi:hypothetical protein
MTKFQNNAVTAGLMIGAAFFIARLAMVRSLRDFFLAAGTGLMEIAVVLFLEWKAKGLQCQMDAWGAAQQARSQAEQLARTAAEELERRLSRIAEIKRAIAKIEESLAPRVWGNDPEESKALAIAAVRAGYHEGIAENRAASVVAREAVA